MPARPVPSARLPARPLGLLLVGLLLSSAGCAGIAAVPDPKVAAEEYAAAAERGDADAIWKMLSKRSQATMSRADVDRVVGSARTELGDQAKALRAASGNLVAVARLRFEDGSESSLVLKDGRFWVQTVGIFPGGGSTPEEALVSLRDVLKRRSYPALLRLLSPTLRAAVEAQLKGLAEALENPNALQIPPGGGDEVEVKLTNGHKVKLRREQGTWYVENFE